ncbi:uncharacterized protein BCR38DRAFT_348917 [Pseudomassariella vexata]|uniref:FHA domain-containing protein n=1 Tax=Pseudomassariella vexata TaxID=1141098 RepID=A0A1Y2DNF7_9PEZI|nr:uncharacterized protein BCR38DRAFT_348917 [Pseudomassariella vexata]ORY60694.1 hypothetical protein BCR38DRAFT_348917 [Pseudomassariella vexata]
MTAVASPPTFQQHNRPAWGINGSHTGQSLNPMNPEELNRMFMPRKSLQRNNSSSSISSTSSASSTATVASSPNPHPQPNGVPMPAGGDLSSWQNGNRKRPQGKAPWPSPKPDQQPDFGRMAAGRPQMIGGLNGSGVIHQGPAPILQSQVQITSQQGMPRPMPESLPPGGQPVLYLLSLNSTFERKTISVPFSPDTLRIGRQTNAKTVPTPINGFFDSKVLSRQHAEIWADRQGKIWIRDVKSSNGTFVNGTRLSQENRESEPHELQTGDHLELGIDIVSEDQKTVVHHKVAAKVEHAGFLNNSGNLLDMNFGDLDPSNGSMMMPPPGGIPYRGRNGSNASMASNGGRMMTGGGMMGAQANIMVHQRGFFFSPISTEQIVKKLQSEMRTAHLQSQDLSRTGQFIGALLSKDDIKDMEKPEPLAEPPKPQLANGNGVSFRTDSKTRFSDPPAPPPQQPLPEKPDVPSLKRGITERPKSHPLNLNVSPIRQDGNVSQILQLTEALNSAKKEIETQTSRMRDLEDMLQKERHARELAEEQAKRLEDAAASQLNGIAATSEGEGLALVEAFKPPTDSPTSPEDDTPTSDVGKGPPPPSPPPQFENIEASATTLHSQLESMVLEIKDLKQQLEGFKQHAQTFQQRAETAEAERDADRKTLADMALQIRKDAEARDALIAAAHGKSGSRSNSLAFRTLGDASETSEEPATSVGTPSTSSSGGRVSPGVSNDDAPTLSRANTITPQSGPSAMTDKFARDQALAHGVPYASILGVVLIGMGLMAYINGWQPQPARMDL